jgi:hypothetical protein
VHRVLMGKSEGKRPLERPRRAWEDGISGSSWLMIGAGGGLCEYADEPSGSVTT